MPGNGPLAPAPGDGLANPSPDMPYVSYCFRFVSSHSTYTFSSASSSHHNWLVI